MNCTICGGRAHAVYQHPEVALFRCTSCDHCFADQDSIIDPESYDLDYGDEAHKNWFENPNVDLFDWIDRVLDQEPNMSSVLDLGCGRADLLRFLYERHPSWSLTGVEQTRFDPPDGIEVITGDIMSAEIDRTFDAVVALAVIEHVDDPARLVQRAIDQVRPGGLVVMMTLNERSVLYATSRLLRRAGLSGPFDQLYSKHHLHHFNKRSMQEVFVRAGLSVEQRHDHNIPAAAVDFESQGPVSDAVRLMGARLCFAAGRLTGRCYLQTLVGRVPGDGAATTSGTSPDRASH